MVFDTGPAPGPVGLVTVAVAVMFHWSAQPRPAGELSRVPDHLTVPVGYVVVKGQTAGSDAGHVVNRELSPG
jgi:hypothetical protein